MQISLRVSPETVERLQALAQQTGKTKTALIIEALYERYECKKDRAQLIRDVSGWMSPAECKSLRKSVENFNAIDDEDWQCNWSSQTRVLRWSAG